MQKFLIKTHGCKSNQLESIVMKERLIDAGFAETKIIDDADIYVLNSCSVTETADIEALRTIRNLKRKNPSLLTILTGCSAQLNYEKIKELDYIDIILGNDDKFNIVEHIKNQNSLVSDIFSLKYFNNQFIQEYSNTRGYLKIQDGCNNYCSYCTIPLARGNSRSNSIENLIKQVELYENIGIKEVVLTGIHIGQWGVDFSEPKTMLDLLKVLEKTNIQRYRLGSLNPLELNDELLNFLSKSEKFCPHFHLSLQSLTDKTLFAMNRKYSAQECMNLIEKIYNSFENPFIGSDIIVGFPGESEEDYETTLQNVTNSKLSCIHVFPYSIRKNTKASEMKPQIAEKVKQERAKLLQKVAKEKLSTFMKSNLNTVHSLLIEKRPDKTTGLLKGVTENYLNVLIEDANISLHNTIQKVKINSVSQTEDFLYGQILSN